MNLEELLLIFDEPTENVVWCLWEDPEDLPIFGLILVLNIKIIDNRLFFKHLGPGAPTADPWKRKGKWISHKMGAKGQAEQQNIFTFNHRGLTCCCAVWYGRWEEGPSWSSPAQSAKWGLSSDRPPSPWEWDRIFKSTTDVNTVNATLCKQIHVCGFKWPLTFGLWWPRCV